MNPDHEVELAERLRTAFPDLSISLSHEVYPRWRENDRGHTTIADAYLKPMFTRYIDNLQTGLSEAGSPAQLLVMKSNGGVVEGDTAADQPANYLVSGPVGGILGGAHFAALAGLEDIMTIDIGGTSCDVSLVDGGELRRAGDFEIAFGMPVRAPMVDIRTIGAGGGSIAWIDAGGLLRVGPQSAGSDPGPACYAQGGHEATLSDANLVLNRMNPGNFCGGDIRLDAELARSAVGKLADGLGWLLEETAQSIIELADHNMVDALSVISVERGIDPRDFALGISSLGLGLGPVDSGDDGLVLALPDGSRCVEAVSVEDFLGGEHLQAGVFLAEHFEVSCGRHLAAKVSVAGGAEWVHDDESAEHRFVSFQHASQLAHHPDVNVPAALHLDSHAP